MSIKKILGIRGVVFSAALLTLSGLSAVLVDHTNVTLPRDEIVLNLDLPEPEQVAPEMELPEPQIADYRQFEATAYCDYGITFSGVLVQRGIVAADPRILPIGSVIEVSAGHYSGIYMVMDTGGKVEGEIIDIYMPDYEEAIQFGRQPVVLRVLRHGWLSEPDSGISYTSLS